MNGIPDAIHNELLLPPIIKSVPMDNSLGTKTPEIASTKLNPASTQSPSTINSGHFESENVDVDEPFRRLKEQREQDRKKTVEDWFNTVSSTSNFDLSFPEFPETYENSFVPMDFEEFSSSLKDLSFKDELPNPSDDTRSDTSDYSNSDSESFSGVQFQSIPEGSAVSKIRFFFNRQPPPCRDLDHLPVFPFHRILQQVDVSLVDSLIEKVEDEENIALQKNKKFINGFETPESNPSAISGSSLKNLFPNVSDFQYDTPPYQEFGIPPTLVESKMDMVCRRFTKESSIDTTMSYATSGSLYPSSIANPKSPLETIRDFFSNPMLFYKADANKYLFDQISQYSPVALENPQKIYKQRKTSNKPLPSTTVPDEINDAENIFEVDGVVHVDFSNLPEIVEVEPPKPKKKYKKRKTEVIKKGLAFGKKWRDLEDLWMKDEREELSSIYAKKRYWIVGIYADDALSRGPMIPRVTYVNSITVNDARKKYGNDDDGIHLLFGEKSMEEKRFSSRLTHRVEKDEQGNDYSRFEFALPIEEGEELMDTEEDFELPYDIQLFAKVRNTPRTRRLDGLHVVRAPKQPPVFQQITANIFVERKPRKADNPICACKPSPGDTYSCTEDCLNRCMFIECTPDRCPAGPLCQNQRFQRLEEPRHLEVFWADAKGYGLRTNTFIPAGMLVIEYRGEIISHKTVMERMNTIYASSENLYFLDYSNGEVIDGHQKGTVARFINHSCEPNCRIEKWCVDGEFCVGLFSSQNIVEGSELTYDYRFQAFGPMQKCLCGSEKCRGYIGVNKRAEIKELKDKKGANGKKLKKTKRYKTTRYVRTQNASPAPAVVPVIAPAKLDDVVALENPQSKNGPLLIDFWHSPSYSKNFKRPLNLVENCMPYTTSIPMVDSTLAKSYREVMYKRGFVRQSNILLPRNMRSRLKLLLDGKKRKGWGSKYGKQKASKVKSIPHVKQAKKKSLEKVVDELWIALEKQDQENALLQSVQELLSSDEDDLESISSNESTSESLDSVTSCASSVSEKRSELPIDISSFIQSTFEKKENENVTSQPKKENERKVRSSERAKRKPLESQVKKTGKLKNKSLSSKEPRKAGSEHSGLLNTGTKRPSRRMRTSDVSISNDLNEITLKNEDYDSDKNVNNPATFPDTRPGSQGPFDGAVYPHETYEYLFMTDTDEESDSKRRKKKRRKKDDDSGSDWEGEKIIRNVRKVNNVNNANDANNTNDASNVNKVKRKSYYVPVKFPWRPWLREDYEGKNKDKKEKVHLPSVVGDKLKEAELKADETYVPKKPKWTKYLKNPRRRYKKRTPKGITEQTENNDGDNDDNYQPPQRIAASESRKEKRASTEVQPENLDSPSPEKRKSTRFTSREDLQFSVLPPKRNKKRKEMIDVEPNEVQSKEKNTGISISSTVVAKDSNFASPSSSIPLKEQDVIDEIESETEWPENAGLGGMELLAAASEFYLKILPENS